MNSVEDILALDIEAASPTRELMERCSELTGAIEYLMTEFKGTRHVVPSSEGGDVQ
jgi:hypothetical protein